MRRLVFLLAATFPLPLLAQTQGWGDMGKEAEAGFSWTQPLFNGFWMAWTPATLAFFIFIFCCIALMGVLEFRNPGGAPRHGILGLDTTRGDRLFISLLGSAYIFIAWLFFLGVPIWGGLAISIVWAGLVFWKV
jgi:predicted small integral membrane protein